MTSLKHQDKLKQLAFLSEEAQRNRQDNLNYSDNYRHTPSEVADDNSSLGQNGESDLDDEDEDVGMDPADWGYPLHFDPNEEEKEEEEEEEPGMSYWDWHWGNETSASNEEPPTLGPNQSYTQPGPQRSRRVPANAPWYPFPTKEYMIASLILGYLHNVMSRTMYNHLRLILTVCVVNLPHWDTIRRFRAKLREMTKVDVVENQTVLSNRTFSLSAKNIIANELANPLVVNHMEFAGPLEIAEPIIAELNELATHGSVAYDAQLGQEVLFMSRSQNRLDSGSPATTLEKPGFPLNVFEGFDQPGVHPWCNDQLMIINLTTRRHHSRSLSSINDQSMIIINLTTRRHHSLVSLISIMIFADH
ncbi:hypothetical protein H4Q26_013688 [Puccinia striiformis f. sp. tritici PST-130]|nr:hypothetical protein H4Q26_013688 [Puccinia striiformis f. sp. tritici PST-130]